MVCDLDAADPGLAARLGEFALVLLTGVLQFLRAPERAMDLAAVP
jgi:hypothetical protein